MRIRKHIFAILLTLFLLLPVFYFVDGPWSYLGLTKSTDVGYNYAVKISDSDFSVGGYKSITPEVFLKGRHIVKDLAKNITRNDTTDLEKAQSLVKWTFLHVRSQSAGPNTVIQDDFLGILRRGWGFCDQKAHIYATLATQVGIPSRQLQLFKVNYESPHTLSESYINGKWIVIDSWRGFIPLDKSGNPVTKEELASSDLIEYFKGMQSKDFLNAKIYKTYPYTSNLNIVRKIFDRILNRVKSLTSMGLVTTSQKNQIFQKIDLPKAQVEKLDEARLAHLELKYDLAIMKYTKISEDPVYHELIRDQAKFWLGVALADNLQFDRSIATFRAHYVEFPQSAFRKSDLRFEAEILLIKNQRKQALKILEQLKTEQARVSVLLLKNNLYYTNPKLI